MCEIINTVCEEAEHLHKSGPKSNTFEKIRQVYSEHNRPVVTEADLTDKIYMVETEKDEETDRLFLDSDGDYGEETCED
jgi:hypothetical protein